MAEAPLTLALGQVNVTVGDLEGNVRKIAEYAARAGDAGADLAVFPELGLTGYPPEDLLLKLSFLEETGAALHDLAGRVRGMACLVGFPEYADDVYNSAALLDGGSVAAVYRKINLPNYGVFDERRYFRSGTEPAVVDLRGERAVTSVGVTICEDIWEPGPPATTEAHAGARVIANLSASPYHARKGLERERMLAQRARDSLAGFALCNLVGGQDELVFDGHSVVVDHDGEVLARAPQFEEALLVCTVDPDAAGARRLQDARHRSAVRSGREPRPDDTGGPAPGDPAEEAAKAVVARVAVAGRDSGDGRAVVVGGPRATPKGPDEEVYAALVTGLRDYVEKNGFDRVIVALSGGIDSACVGLVAVDALGADRVVFATMPSRYSSEDTRSDASLIAGNLGAELVDLPIEGAVEAFDETLADRFRGTEPGIAEENVQARIRGMLVMALSNKFGWLVLTTGNKSELSVGYATLYGDMAGGFAVLKDVFKGTVYRLVRWRNGQAGRDLVPPSVLDRPPSAELRYGQRDQDSLPSYDVLDRILAGYVEQDLDAEQLVRQGLERAEVERVIGMVDGAEYKRRQAPPGIRISTKAFGRDRRLPITNRFSR
jgi:NAD+ synthase (glutamine-hydrolysing)